MRCARDRIGGDRETLASRRRFLRFLATSPVLAAGWSSQGFFRPTEERSPFSSGGGVPEDELILSPEEALDVFDFHAVAKRSLPPAHYGYMATGVDDDATLRANREGFAEYGLRVRRLIDVRQIDLSTELLGTRWKTPIVLAPVASQEAFHPDGERAVALASGATEHLMMLSTVSTTSVEEVTELRGAPPWFQLYATDDWSVTRRLLARAERAGCPAVALTVDLQGGTNRETLARWRRRDERRCSSCHEGEGLPGYLLHKPFFDGLDLSGVERLHPRDMTWEFLERLKEATTMKVLVKGIVTAEDAELCLTHCADGLVVSNHGGRAEESGRSTIECLAEIVDAVGGRLPILIDGGFRRGTDVFKALALGATAICIGRPYLWGLAAFGREGVEAVLDLLVSELEMVMRQAGTTSIDQITRAYITG